ncbi:MAG: nuclear transport factor 2 family protein [Gemmatimonadota bacterium]|nr:nuclear transport factor 2 family protein [Gemmatimonadota bacterium]
MKRILFLSVAVALIPAGSVGQSDAPLADVVREREIAFAKTMADRDHDAFRSFLSRETVFFSGDAPIRGADAVADAWARFYEGEDPPFSWHPDLVEVLESGTLALSSGPVRDPNGAVVGRFNSVWRLESDGEWRVVFDKGCP